MEVLDELSSSEKMLALRAAAMHVPLGGTFELLPLCNMDCKMCYIHANPEVMKAQGHLLSVEQWIEIAKISRDKGMLYLLLTGGEPLLYPGFKELYQWLGTSGIVVMLNTNGTMMTEEIANLLAKYPPRKVNISLYGASAETYKNLCGYEAGFEKTLHGIRMLKERNIPVKINSSITPLNVQDMEKMGEICKELDVPFQTTPYMFPPVRKQGYDVEKFIRFTPEEAAQAMMKNARMFVGTQERFRQWVKHKLVTYEANKGNNEIYKEEGIGCFATKNHFWVNWKGEMTPCGMINVPPLPILEEGFDKCWEETGVYGEKIQNPKKCTTCELRSLCTVCTASSLAEAGECDEVPEYLCQITKHFLTLLQEVNEEYNL